MIRRRNRRDELAPRNVWGPLWSNPLAMLNDMDRLFDDFRTDWETMFLTPRTQQGEPIRQPLVDLVEEEKGFVLRAEIPGIDKDGLNIEVTETGIEISGESTAEREEEDKESGYVRRERHYARFHRSLPFPEKIVPDEVDAELKDGILTVKAPKAAPPERKTTKVSVK